MDSLLLLSLVSFISATQLGITFSSLAVGWVGEPAVANFLEPLLAFLPKNLSIFSAHALAFTLAFILITFFHILLGELSPKAIALQKAESVALFTIVPLTIFARIFKPFIVILNIAGRLVLKMFNLPAPSDRQIVGIVTLEDVIESLVGEF